MHLLAELNYLPDRPEAEILGEYVRAVDRLFEPSRFLARLHRHILAMRPTRRQLKRQEGEQEISRKKSPIPLGTELKNLLALARFCWRHGVLAAYRRQFWWQLLDIYRKNPSRLKKYLIICFLGESIFWLRKEVLRLAAAESGAWGHKTRSA
jgi:hypothetical protein